eukprot:m.29303 g.29303  ORF g.29303 m.29303 type:complete len:506 (-) comp16074_c0_seq1:54-1571(-)
MNLTLASMVFSALVILVIKRIVEYFQWRARIDAIGGPTASYLSGTQKHGGKLAIPNSRHKAMCKLVAEFPKAFRMWKGPFLPMIYLVSPEAAKTVLDAKATPKAQMMTRLFDHHLGGKSILIATGEQWKESRRLFTPAFHFKVLDQYMREMIHILDDYVSFHTNRIDAGAPIDMQEGLVDLYLKILLQTVYSCETNSLTSWRRDFIEVAKACDAHVGHRIDNPLHMLLPNWLYIKTAKGKAYIKDADKLRVLSQTIIEERIAANATKGEFYLQDRLALGGRLDFLDLILSQYDTPEEIDKESVISQTTTFSSAGSNTAAAAVSFTLYCLAKDKVHQNKVYEEVCQVFDDVGPNIDLNTVGKFKFLSMCYKEATRIFPPIPRVVKDLLEPIEINGTMIEPGTTMIVSIYSVHHNPTVWPDPEKFDPYRFDPSVERDPYAFLLYSAGQRNCLGQKYADMMTKITIAKLIQAFEVSVVSDFEPQLVPNIILSSDNGVQLHLTPRAPRT